MKSRFFIPLFLILSFIVYDDFSSRQKLSASEYAQTNVYYSQTSETDLEIIKTINDADKYVYFVIYTLTKENIVDALIAAKLRGLEVKGVLDFNQSTISQEKPLITKLKKYNIETKIPEKESGLMHIKMMVTDKAYASGSFNWTASATKYNDEVLEIGKVKYIHDQYLKIWQTIYRKY